MAFKTGFEGLNGAYARSVSRWAFRRTQKLRPRQPLVSFTFDDFPRSALLNGGAILARAGVAGTFYASLGLQGKPSPSGPIFTLADLEVLFEQGHELGCHTFSHLDAWKTAPHTFERSVIENQLALTAIRPGAVFRSHAYPLAPPRPFTKARVARHVECSRGGGQATNHGVIDLNHLKSFFLEKTRGDFKQVQNIVDHNRSLGGWLIFSTHDVASQPSRYGCTQEFFERTMGYAIDSGARVLPVIKVIEELVESAG